MVKRKSENIYEYAEEDNKQTVKQIVDAYSLGVVEELDEYSLRYERGHSEK